LTIFINIILYLDVPSRSNSDTPVDTNNPTLDQDIPTNSLDDISITSRVQENAIQKPHYYTMSFHCPPIEKFLQPMNLSDQPTDGVMSPAQEQVSNEGVLYLDLQLDGVTMSPEACMCQVNLIKSISINQPIIVPKGIYYYSFVMVVQLPIMDHMIFFDCESPFHVNADCNLSF
jgi:hypothetical protein